MTIKQWVNVSTLNNITMQEQWVLDVKLADRIRDQEIIQV